MRTRLELSQRAMIAGDIGEARRVLAWYIAEGIRNYDLCELAIMLHQVTGEREMLDAVRDTLRQCDDHFAREMIEGVLFAHEGRAGEALDRWSAAHRRIAGHPDPVLFTARLLAAEGRLAEALHLFRVTRAPPVEAPDSAWNALWAERLIAARPARRDVAARVYLACHKPFPVIRHPPFAPIHAGKAAAAVDLGLPGDDTGDNISAANPIYCELTVQYWVWKNVRDLTHVGFGHYRRIPWFGFEPSYPYKFATPFVSYSIPRRLAATFDHRPDPAMVGGLLADHDILVPRAVRLTATLREQWAEHHPPESLEAIERIGALRSPYGAALRDAFDGTRMTPYNMFIMRWDLFDEYCAWLFGTLALFDELHPRLAGRPTPPRMAGFLAERLLNAFLLAKAREGARILEMPLVVLL
ncbi:MAG: DUF4422 domain-containing protein [Alphaproteobacteria bacterium]|nr:DUF4422 domain-containing protein [Alphaproteobacteria bacterium]